MAIKSNVFLCAAKRTPLGSFQGCFSQVSAPDLAARLVSAVLEEAKLAGKKIDQLILGNVLSAGLGQAPARQAAIFGGLPPQVQALTVNKVCSSGLKAVMLAQDAIELGRASAILAGGTENMTRSPYLLPDLRAGARLGHSETKDSIVHDALWDVYNNYHMGSAAELCARTYAISREAQDVFAASSYQRALAAIKAGHFKNEIVPIKVKKGKEEVSVEEDEEPGRGNIERFASLKPVFEKDGTVTAANASSINDGAAMLLVCSEAFAKAEGLTPLARIISQGQFGQAPEWFTTAPVGALKNALSAASLSLADIDLFEINEAFSAVALACSKDLEIPAEKLNISGGAVALGHPVGASGARILTTLLHSLQRLNLKRGAVAICNGGGEATAMVLERV